MITRRYLRKVRLLIVLTTSTAACDLPVTAPGEGTQSIIGGQVDLGDPAVVYTTGTEGACTGTLVADRVVLSAAHCLPQTRVYFGNAVGEFTDQRRVVQQIASRYYAPEGAAAIEGGDVALLRLESPAPEDIAPIPINTAPLDPSVVGAIVRMVGFGNTDGETGTGAGTKRHVSLEVTGLTSEHIIYGDEFVNTCQGDSGGPTFLDFEGTEHVIAVTSFGDLGCAGEAKNVRTDVYYQAFLEEVIDAWSGPCKQDGTCVTEGCRTPDPDCDICGFDGLCGTGCEKKDLDCPLSGFQGDPCDDREDCETLVCLEAPEDPRVKYCSNECDPNELDDFWGCRTPLSICAPASNDKHYCVYSGTTPGVQGYECTEASECRSSVCYPPGNGICAEQCGDGFPACNEPYSCEVIGEDVNLCLIPEEGGGCCQTSGSRSGRSTAGLLLLGAFVAMLLVGRRRR